MKDESHSDANLPPSWFADFEEKLVELIRKAPGSQAGDLGACLTVLIPRGGGADNAIFGGMVTAKDEHPGQMQEEVLTAVIWALLADGVAPDVLRATFEHSMITAHPMSAELAAVGLDELDEGIVN